MSDRHTQRGLELRGCYEKIDHLEQKLEKIEKWLDESINGYTYINELYNLVKGKKIIGEK